MKKGVSHLRVSSPGQGQRGFGLEDQRRIIDYYFKQNKIKLVKEFVEVGSGRPRKRPKVEPTLNYCRKHNLPLYVTSQSRLTRNAGFICDLLEEKFKYTNIENPAADDYQKIIQAVFDQKTADDTRRKTKATMELAAKKGIKFGGNSRKRKRTIRKKYKAFLKRIKPIIRRIQKRCITTVRGIMEALNRKRIKTFSGKRGGWHISTVHKTLRDLKI